jgi:hypothetical protein
MMLSIHWQTGRNEPNRAGSSPRSGRSSLAWCPGHVLGEVDPGQALVDDEDLTGLEAASVQQRHGDLPLAQLGAGQAPGDRTAVGGGEQIQLEPPVPARVAGTPAVVGPPAQRRALDGLPRGGAGDRGGVQQPEGVVDAGGLTGQVRQDMVQQPAGLAQPFVVAGLVGR